MIVLKVILFTIFITGLHCRHPDKVFCVNEACNEPISKAKTLLVYTSVEPDLISFRPNSDATVYMKSAGTNSELWFVNINGKTGFANSKFLREYKMLEKQPLIIVPYEPMAKENVQPNKVKQAHEIIDGTTIYTTEAAANNAEQESTTSASVTSSEDPAPSLGNVKEMLDDDVQNISSQTSNEVNENLVIESQSSEPSPEDTNMIENIVSTTTEETDKTILTDLNNEKQNVDIVTQTVPNSSDEVVNNININEQTNKEQHNEDLPNAPSGDAAAQLLLSTVSGALGSKNLLDVPNNKEINSLTESEQTDSLEQNASSVNTNAENVPVNQETTTESNDVVNGETKPITEHVVDQSLEQKIPSEPMNSVNMEFHSDNLPNNNKELKVEIIGDQIHTTAPPIPSEPSPITPLETLTTETLSTLPPTYSPLGDNTQSPALDTIPPLSPPSDSIPPPPLNSIPLFPPVLDAIPPLAHAVKNEPLPESNPLPNFADPESQTIPATLETVETFESVSLATEPPITETIPPIYSQAPYTPNADVMYDTTSTSDYNVEDTSNLEYSTEHIPVQDPSLEQNANSANSDQPDETPSATTEVPVEDGNTQGFISNIISTVADIWPSSSEAPSSIYSTEEFPSHETEESDNLEEINTGFSFMKYIMSTYYTVMGTSDEAKAVFSTVAESCYSEEYCDGTSNSGTNRLLTFLLTTASSVLLFTLGYYYIDNRRQDGRLIGQINSLQRDLLFTSKECEILKEELTSTKNKLAGIEDSSFGKDDMVQSLKEEISELKVNNDRLRNSLDDNEKLLRVSENTAGELQNTLSEVENTLSELLAERANSEEQIVELNGKIQAFEEEFISVSRDRDNFQLKYVSAESALEEFKKQKKQFEEMSQKLADAKNTIELQKYEIDALKDAIKELKSGNPSNVDATSLIDHTEIKAKLSKAIEEKKVLETKYEVELKEKSRLSEELQTTQETLHTTSQNASEALTRLDVLGKYFQERETELLKELNAKESLWLSKQGESASTVEKIELLQQEVQRYKEKCDALTLELAEQESSRRTALSSLEARAHAAWLEARAAKRDTDAARDEAAALRRKLASLTAITVADGAVSPHHKVASPLENLDNAVIPPPLPPMFLPPPLLPPLPRPPPLGRLPSPHPPRYGDRRYSPESRYSPGSRYSPDSRYSPETVRYSPDSRYSPRSRRPPYSPRSRRRSRSRERYEEGRGTRSRNGPADTETEYNSDSPSREPRRRSRYSRHSGPSSGSGCSSESDK